MNADCSLHLKLSEICRLCLSQEEEMLSIFKNGIDVQALPKKIMTCVSVKVVAGDGLPNLICHKCSQHIDSWYKFKKQCQNSDDTLRHYISRLQSDCETDNAEDTNLPSSVPEEHATKRKTKSRIRKTIPNARRRRVTTKKQEIKEVFVCPEVPCEVKLEVKDEGIGNEKLQQENSSHINTRGFLCHLCNRTFSSKSCLQNHQAIHTKEKNFSCSEVPVCPEFTCEVKVNVKDESIENEKLQQENGSDINTKGFLCRVCNRTFSSKSYLQDHQAIHTGEKNFTCSECGKGFYSDRKLTLHIKTHSSERPCLCSVCGKAFREKSDLKKHFRLHSDDSPFLCNVCGKTFKTKFYLTRHLMIHSGEKHYTCADCGKAFTWRDTLTAHAKVHALERPLPCTVCNKGFKRKEDLMRHMRIHTGEKPFVCPYCRRRFSDKWNLTQHIRLHTGHKPYVCSVCCQAFTHNVTLRNHIKQQHPVLHSQN